MKSRVKASLLSLLVWIISGAVIELISILAFQDSGAPFLIAQNFEGYVVILTDHPVTFLARSLMSNVLAIDVFIGYLFTGPYPGTNGYLFVIIMVIKGLVPPLLVAWVYARSIEYDAQLVSGAGGAVSKSITIAFVIMMALILAILYDAKFTDGWSKTSEDIIGLISIVFGHSTYFVTESMAFFGITLPTVNLMPSPDPVVDSIGSTLGSVFLVFGMGFVLTTLIRFFAMLFIMREGGDQFASF
jgi:hypothetical protein